MLYLVKEKMEVHIFMCINAINKCLFKMKEGRRTSSLKASYEAFKNNDFQLGKEFSMPRETTGYSSSSALMTTLTQNASSSAADSRSGRKSK